MWYDDCTGAAQVSGCDDGGEPCISPGRTVKMKFLVFVYRVQESAANEISDTSAMNISYIRAS